MSARWCRGVVLAAALAGAASGTARAQDSVVVAVGGALAAGTGEALTVPITADLRAAPGRSLGGWRITVRWDPLVLGLNFHSILFGAGHANTDSVGFGKLTVAGLAPNGATGVIPLADLHFVVQGTTPSAITLQVHELTATAASVTPFEDLTPIARAVNGAFCQSLGRWGDVDGDSVSNSRDALVALSAVVGLAPPAGMNPALADVDADGAVTSRDALIILSYSVGLPVSGYRILVRAPGGCSAGSPAFVAAAPDTVELLPGQLVRPLVDARDAAGLPTTNLQDLTWRTRDATVAGVVVNYSGVPEIQGRSPGATWVVAELGGGLRDSIRVEVVARRVHWVDAAARGAPFQLGSVRHPYSFINDAVEPLIYDTRGWQAPPGLRRTAVINDGDTVRVRPGVYEEQIQVYDVSVTILGDSLNRPVIDARGDPSYDDFDDALEADGPVDFTIAHFIVRGGGFDIDVINTEVRRVRFENLNDTEPLDITADWVSELPGLRGHVVVEHVEAYGFRDVSEGTADGISINDADSVRVRFNTLRGDTTMSAYSCSASSSAGIRITDGRIVRVTDNVVDGAACVGIAVSSAGDPGSRAEIQRNRVSRTRYAGIAVSSQTVDLRHNVVRTIRNPDLYSYRAGIQVWTDEQALDSLAMLGDSIVDVGGPGLWLDSGRVVVVESLTVTRAGLDSVYYYGQYNSLQAAGLVLNSTRARITLRHNRIDDVRNPYSTVAHGIAVSGHLPRVATLGNRVTNVPGDGIRLVRDCFYYYCFVGDTLTADSALLVRDTVIGAAGAALIAYRGGVVRADSLVARRAYDAAIFSRLAAGHLRHAMLVDDTAGVLFDGVAQALLFGSFIDSTFVGGVRAQGATTLLVDSSAIVRSAGTGLEATGQGRVTVRRTRFEANQLGLTALASSLDSVFVRQSSFLGNVLGGISNQRTGFDVLADSNYWNSALGPSCQPVAGSCAAGAGDSIVTAGVVFTPFLTSGPVTGVARPWAAAAPVRRSAGGRAWMRPSPAPSPRAAPPAATVSRRPAHVRERRQQPAWQNGPEPVGWDELRRNQPRRP